MLAAKPHFSFRDEITVEDDILYKGDRIIMPTSLRPQMLKKIHEGHQGIVKCKNMARDVLYWPSMGSEIETVVSKCSTCQSNRKQEASEPMIPHEIPDRPYAKVGTDLFKLNGMDYINIGQWPQEAAPTCKLNFWLLLPLFSMSY